MANDSGAEENQKKNGFIEFFKDHYVLSIISFLFFVFILLSPIIFTRPSPDWLGISFGNKSGDIGSTFGIMNPFIAIAAAFITFAAFWVQYKANVDVRADVNVDRKEKRKEQIISRFYEMLQIHRENVKELEWNQKIHYEEDSSHPQVECVQNRGRQIFFYYLIEFNFIYSIIKGLYPKLGIKDKVKKAYNIFYKNVNDERLSSEKRKRINEFIQNDEYKLANSFFDICNIFEDYQIDENDLNLLIKNKDYFKLQPLFRGHFDELNNYYRHLFLTVKTIANGNKKDSNKKENKDDLSYDEKRDLLRILRAQLTNTEQIMLFYNWFSGNGWQWEQDDLNGNHFFTQYRMVHNIMPSRMIPIYFYNGINDEYQNFINYLKTQPIYTYIKKFCSKDDPMFECEDWEGCPKFDYDN